jgi:hypothetical protein
MTPVIAFFAIFVLIHPIALSSVHDWAVVVVKAVLITIPFSRVLDNRIRR